MQRWGLGTLQARLNGGRGLRDLLFSAAAVARPADSSELVPYWIYPPSDGGGRPRPLHVFAHHSDSGASALDALPWNVRHGAEIVL